MRTRLRDGSIQETDVALGFLQVRALEAATCSTSHAGGQGLGCRPSHKPPNSPGCQSLSLNKAVGGGHGWGPR